MKYKKKHQKIQNNYSDNDFSDILRKRKPDKFKPVLKVLVIVIVIAGLGYGSVHFLNQNSTSDNDTAFNPTSELTTASHNPTGAKNKSEDNSPQSRRGKTQPANDNGEKQTQTSTNEKSTTQSSNTHSSSHYDPHKCDSDKSKADGLQATAQQDYKVFQNALNSSKNYGYFYDQAYSRYGDNPPADKAAADQAYNAQEAKINQLQSDWKNTLDESNAAYEKLQECQKANPLQ